MGQSELSPELEEWGSLGLQVLGSLDASQGSKCRSLNSEKLRMLRCYCWRMVSGWG